jgi:16S rRNA (uracil1498-N3)-methyltransferase
MSTTWDTMPMTRPRLYTENLLQSGTELELSGDAARYIGRVLRLRRQDEICLFDGRGGEYNAVIKTISKTTARIAVGDRVDDANVESPLAIHLLQGVSRGERMDFVVQKATELGVCRITPLVTEYSVVRFDRNRAAKREHHWQRISASACEQCGRNVLPVIDTPISYHEWLGENLDCAGRRLVFRPDASQTLKTAAVGANAITVLVGPEGGFSAAEYARAGETGFEAVGLGPRVLRTETAAVAAIAALQALYGDLA